MPYHEMKLIRRLCNQRFSNVYKINQFTSPPTNPMKLFVLRDISESNKQTIYSDALICLTHSGALSQPRKPNLRINYCNDFKNLSRQSKIVPELCHES